MRFRGASHYLSRPRETYQPAIEPGAAVGTPKAPLPVKFAKRRPTNRFVSSSGQPR